MKRITSFLLAIVLFAGFVLTGVPTVQAAGMTSSSELVEMIKGYEGFVSYPCWDYGQYSVGYGTRCPDDMLETYMEHGISVEDAEVLLCNHLSIAENAVYKRFVQELGIPLNQSQFDALVSFTYNLGSAWMYDDDGTLVKAIRNGTVGSEMIRAFSLWCNAGGSILPGLVYRRLSEANMYLNGEYSMYVPDDYGYVYYNANGGSVIFRIQGYDANEGTAPAYTPTYGDRTFMGWYTSQTGGEQVTVLTMEHSGETLYARWDQGVDNTETETETKPVTVIKIKVTADDVNLRRGPGTNYTIVGTANTGDQMEITEVAEGSGYIWGKDGDRWIALKYTNYEEALKAQMKDPEATEPSEPETTVPEETKPETAPATGTVKANGGLALREGPGTGYTCIRYLDNGSKVTISEQKTVGSMTWGYTGEGWISMTYVVLDKVPEATVPETTAPETTAPETTVPETTVPETTVPETTVPETTVPETTIPETTIPEETVPETTIPEETVPETTVPEETEPEITVPESTAVTGVVKADGGLLVRSGPDTSYDYIWFLYDGERVTVSEQKTTGSRTWGKISQGWICMDYVVLSDGTDVPVESEPEEEETGSDNGTALYGTVKADGGLAVRRGAGTSYSIKEYLIDGSSVTITDVEEVNGTKWGYMGSGWICMDYVVIDGESENNSRTIIADCLNVREEPTLYSSIVGYYYYGARVEILETADADGLTWGKTSKGWVCMDYVV